MKRLPRDDVAVHQLGDCDVPADSGAAPAAEEAIAATVGAALEAAHAAGQRAVLLVCPAAASLEVEMAVLKEAHGAVSASGRPYAAILATQPVCSSVASCILKKPSDTVPLASGMKLKLAAIPNGNCSV